MKIIIDTREQKPLSFPGYETVNRKLDEGDYNIIELENKIVIERKSIEDFYGSVIQGHQRFKKEILRARDKNKKFYIFIEGRITDILDYCIIRNFKPETMTKIINTMIKRYELVIVECETRDEMSKKICTEMEKWLTQQEQVKESM